jgi:hypothetical protein
MERAEEERRPVGGLDDEVSLRLRRDLLHEHEKLWRTAVQK